MEGMLQKVIIWAKDRNILEGSHLEMETLSLVSKCGYLTHLIDNVNRPGFSGDFLV